MNNTRYTAYPATSYLTLRIIHLAMCLGAALFLAVTIFLKPGKVHSSIEPDDALLVYIATGVAVAAAFLSNFLYQMQLVKIDINAPVVKRVTAYVTASILRYAVLEGAALFNIVVWFLTQNVIPAIIGGAIVLLLIILRPVKDKVSKLLQISYPETL